MSTRSRRLSRTLGGALAVAALAAPTAGAMPAEYVQASPSADISRTPVPIDANTEAPRPTVTTTIDDGFDVGSAAIGAGGAAAVLLLTGGAAASLRHRRLGVVR